MLLNLHVKNLALIDESEVDFKEGLNILTGETGAGKSIIIGSVNIALGGKVSRDIIRHGADYAMVELVFESHSKELEAYFEEHDLEWEDGQIIISRKIMSTKSVVKINGETVSLSMLKEIASMLMDIHGQHDNESLLKTSRHLDMIDAFGGTEIQKKKSEIAILYRQYKEEQEKLEGFSLDEEGQRREISFLEFEVNEISEAALQEKEDEELEEEYRRMSNAEKIYAGIGGVYECLSGSNQGIQEQMGRAVRDLGELVNYDEKISQFYQIFLDIEALSSDLSKEMADYLEEITFSEERYVQVERRLNEINRLKLKYGKTIEDILNHKIEAEEKLTFYENFQIEKENCQKRLDELERSLRTISQELTVLRQKSAEFIKKNIVKALKDLNFLEVRFEVEFKQLESFTANGMDNVQFLISTNPGEELKTLSKVASGGELSRIMLGFKTILAGRDEIETLIFDEIDTGISGRTAQMVSEKLSEISGGHQVICITHLPQIASMADSHYLIEKSVQDGKTVTHIEALDEEASVQELARMLGGVQITDTVLESAREMKRLAKR